MNQPFERIKAAFSSSPLSFVPKGEVWMGTAFLAAAELDDTLDNHFRMAGILGLDMICLPVTDRLGATLSGLGYRYFEISHLKTAQAKKSLFVAAVVDGPFQSLVNGMGLMEMIKGWVKNKNDLVRVYDREKQRVLKLISQCLEEGIPAVVIADDLAVDQGPLISPADIDGLCSSFYKDAADRIHKANASVLLHSCGNITRLMPLIISWRMDGLAAVQHGVNDLFKLKKHMGPGSVILGGIDAELLEPNPSDEVLSGFKRVLTRLVPGGGIILGSSSGLYDGRFLSRIKEIHAMAQALSEGIPF